LPTTILFYLSNSGGTLLGYQGNQQAVDIVAVPLRNRTLD
jgi:hypothetical protein